MNFQGLHAKYRRLLQESEAWKLLRADNAPMILAFLSELFAEENEIPFSQARAVLEVELQRSRELGVWEAETSAGTYLNQWIRAGWLREMDDLLTKTDASEVAYRFCRGLDQRNAGTTASHLRVVQEAVRDLAAVINPNIDERVNLLEHKKAEIQRDIDALRSGKMVELTEREQRERIQEIYQLASVLTGDFRRVEDEIRLLDQAMRIQVIEEGTTRGEVLLTLMEKEALLERTDAGSAFESFFQLLCDQNRSIELRDQLRSILNQPVARQLALQQQQFLSKLMQELTRESGRVFQVRRRTEEGLRAYIESGAAMENRAVDLLLGKLERLAIALKEGDVDLRVLTRLSLPVGPTQISSPDSLRLKIPDEKLDTSGIEERKNARDANEKMLSYLETVQVQEVARRVKEALSQGGPMTIGDLVEKYPLMLGLEELVAYLRVAKAVGAVMLEKKEFVEVRDKAGGCLKASLPMFIFSVDLFPNNIEDLVI